MMNMLKSFRTRVIAFIWAVAIAGACTLGFTDSIIKNKEVFLNSLPSGIEGHEFNDNIMDLFSKLWFIGNTYLKNTDSKGKYTCSKELENSIKSALYEKGMINEDGTPRIDYASDFQYYVSYNNSVISNTDKTSEQLMNEYGKYCLLYQGNYKNIPEYCIAYCNHTWYSTNYGMYYYNFNSSEKNIALFDFDTTGLDYYIDEWGVKIYYKKDGTTPLPMDSERYVYYADQGYVMEEEEDNVPYKTPEDGEIMIYSGHDGKWFTVDYSKFSQYEGSDANLTIAIVPTEGLIQEYENALFINQQKNDRIAKAIVFIVPFLFILLILSAYFLTADGWSVQENKFVFRRFDRIWSEILLAGIAVCVCLFGIFIDPYEISRISYNLKNNYYIVQIIYTLVIPVIYFIVMILLSSLIRKFKCGKFVETTFLLKIFRKIFPHLKSGFSKAKTEWGKRVSARQLIRNNLFAKKFFIRLGACTLAEAFVILFCWNVPEISIMVMCSLIVFAVFVFLNYWDLQSITKLSQRIENMTKGDYSSNSAAEKDVTRDMHKMLDNISAGIQNAVESQIKSERMKIDLVTNVSHDLKTPLTSIISYIDLLSAEELTPEASDYVKILGQKSERLKSIVSDLFDLAKATSNTDIELENIDMCILVEQVKADMSDKIEKYGREIRTDIQEDTAPIYAEGKKLYRVYQNLIDNALKYSLEGTRIYLKLYKKQNEVITEIKNISAYEMKFTPEEITERFTRGDESRTSEGNGLGLSIAKSFTEACGGKFQIKIDGDVFIAEVKFPLR